MLEKDKYRITPPIIDKITLFADPFLNKEEKKQLNKILYHEAKSQEEGAISDSPVTVMKLNKEQQRATRYKNHYKIKPPESHGSVAFFFDPVGKKQRFIKMEFSPWRLGPQGMAFFIDWYNTNIIHSTYQDAIKEPKCIRKLHIAFDIIGVHIADFVLNYEQGLKSHSWQGKTGRIETLYPAAVPGKPSKLKIYNKVKQAQEIGDYLPYEEGVPVVRVEKEIKTSLSLIDLYKLKKTHFKGVRLPLPSNDGGEFPERSHHWEMFLDSIRFRGCNSALKKIPDHLQPLYQERLEKSIKEVFPYQEIQDFLWKEYWPETIKKSGLLGEA